MLIVISYVCFDGTTLGIYDVSLLGKMRFFPLDFNWLFVLKWWFWWYFYILKF